MNLSLPLHLASASPRRAEILMAYGVSFSRVPNLLYEEKLASHLPLRQGARDLAYRKARASAVGVPGLVLTADTLVVLGDRVLGKPKTLSEAAEMLTDLSDNVHEVMTAFCLWDTVAQKGVTRADVTRVSFRRLSSRDISDYIQCFHVLDKAGGYGIQDMMTYSSEKKCCMVPDTSLISGIEGSYWNVMGLPIELLLRALKKYVIVAPSNSLR
jgi:septum formation protein